MSARLRTEACVAETTDTGNDTIDGAAREEEEEAFVRRSTRDPASAHLERNDVRKLLHKIVENNEETVVLKIKNHLIADINNVVLNAIIDALHKNNVCQALYAQNLVKAMGDKELEALTELCRRKKIWCLNVGENYNVSTAAWIKFSKALKDTNVTHLYVSEHVIKLSLKNEMRANIRVNRKKHTMHSSMKNIRVIERCTNMWWNPINSIRRQLEMKAALAASPPPPPVRADKKKRKRRELTPADTQYWAQGHQGGEKPWKFACLCGETCSSYENYRYHPTGRMVECSQCEVWSHVQCILGNISDEELEETEDILCFKCFTKARRQKLAELREMKLDYKMDGNSLLTFESTEGTSIE